MTTMTVGDEMYQAMLSRRTITPDHAQALTNRTGQPWYLLNGIPFDDDDLGCWYGGVLPDGALTFTPAVISDDPPGPDPDPSTGLGSSDDPGDDPPVGYCCGNWSSHAIQACPEIRARLFAPEAAR